MSSREYLPALRFPALTRFFDPVVRVGLRERRFKRALIEQAAPRPGQKVLDLGCGTGTLAIMVKRAVPGAELFGLDADPEILARAQAKAGQAGIELELSRGLSTALPYEDRYFDRVLSTLFFHHLGGGDKARTAAEIARVLKRGGELHIADFGRQADPIMAGAFLGVRAFDGFENTRDNARGRLPEIFEEAGLEGAVETDRLRTLTGSLSLYRARKP